MANSEMSFGKLHNKCVDEERKERDWNINFIPALPDRIDKVIFRFRGRSSMCGVWLRENNMIVRPLLFG